MAFKLQHPNHKINVSILIRAEDGLFDVGGGEGKNLIFEWFANEILGEKYFICIGNNKELYGSIKLLQSIIKLQHFYNFSNSTSILLKSSEKLPLPKPPQPAFCVSNTEHVPHVLA